MFRTAIVAAVFASAAFAAGCGDDSSMMVMPETDGGISNPPPVPPPTPVPPTPVPPPPMDGGTGDVCTPSADNPLCTGAASCQCDNSGITDFLASNPGIAPTVEAMSRCEPGSMNRCGFACINLPPEMTSFEPFACADFVNDDLWLQEGTPRTTQGSYEYPGGNGQFLGIFNWIPEYILLCTGYDCFAAWGVSDMPGYTGLHVRQHFSEDCQFVTSEYFGPGAPADPAELAHVEDCGDGTGDCP